jgi:phosphoribosylanthranilate isomerase
MVRLGRRVALPPASCGQCGTVLPATRAGTVAPVFVKVCGITRPADAIAAVDGGADAIGLNFVPTSRRCVDVQAARAILAVVPDHVMTVGVFRDHLANEVLEITGALGLEAAQLHGDEPPEVTAVVAAGVETVIKAVAAESPSVRSINEHAADIVLLDAPIPGGGVPFEWGIVSDLVTKHKILLAGGLRPDNVAEAVRRVRPWGVDVASGVEAEPAQKDRDAIARFVAEARVAAEQPTEALA